MPTTRQKEQIVDAIVITAEERTRRQKAIDTAERSIRLEGFELDAETLALNKLYVDGEITSQEHSAAIRRSAGR